MNEQPIVWINGDFVPADEIPLSTFDLGVSVGLGVFETLVGYRGVFPRFDQHLDRLEAAAALVKLGLLSREIISDVMTELLHINQLEQKDRVRVRITLGAGEHVLTAKKVSRSVENYLIISAVPQKSPAASANLAVVPMRCNEYGALAGVKTTSYAENVMAYRHAAMLGADEAVMLNTAGHLCECAMANLFLVKNGEVLTPPLSSGCLPGVTRGTVLDLCMGNAIPVRELDLNEEDLLSADEIFITSSAREVQPAKILESAITCPGEITQRIASAYSQYLKS